MVAAAAVAEASDMAGFLDSLKIEDPATAQGLLQFGLSLLQSKGGLANALGAAGMQGLQGSQQFRDRANAQKRQGMLDQLTQQQIAAGKRQQAMQELPGQFMTGGMKPETMDNRDVGQPGEAPIPEKQFDAAGYGQALMGLDPQAGFQFQQMTRKAAPELKTFKPGDVAGTFENGKFNPVFSVPGAEAKSPSAVQEYEYARGQGYKGTFQDYQTTMKRAGASSVSVGYGAPVAGVGPDGNPLFFQPSKDGKAPAIIPGVAPPKAMPSAAMTEKLAQNAVTLNKIDKALEMVESNPASLGAQNILGDSIMQRVDPAGVEVRAMVADIGGQKIHDRSGASTTVGEAQRLKPYIPSAMDSPDTVKKKLKLFRQEYAEMQQAIQSGASVVQAGQKSTGAGAAPPMSAIDAEIARRQKKGQ